MTDVKCPICRERLSGLDTAELNAALKAHLADNHNVTRIPSGGGASYREGSGAMERSVGTWSTVGPDRLTLEEERQRDVVARYDQPSGPANIEERMVPSERSGAMAPMAEARHGGGALHRMVNRGEMTMTITCPLCSNPVHGSDEEDLSDEIRFHFRDVHHIKRR